jgi:hypothetical protein
MAALPVPNPATSIGSCGPTSLALGAGLVALVTGAAVLLADLLLPISPSHAIDAPRTFLSRAANARLDGGQDTPGVTRGPFLRFTAMTESDIGDHVGQVTANEHTRVPQPVIGNVRSDLNQTIRRPRNCLGNRAESAHLATVPLCHDPRDALAAMAAAQYRGSRIR